ncbi:forkhead-associated domain-containing protein 1 [Plakobranchus ocellatus]|uniref:Forkhead-associated domain-containing protein 1 n=1 Tax=Plakobranchus ocellatus TaxID=259542 RepID=A0AAV4CW64_9GAST|nr:forkhead-associated domain-containing protein 1 [Plakobranchus ocellatus]
MIKAYLKGADGTLFPLLPKVTTIGRENCDFTIQLPGVDYQHCVVEYSEPEDCFVIQDLNTAQGTYVNEVRVQNAAVRLAPGDQIRFGYNGQPFELQVDNQTQIAAAPVTQRPPIWVHQQQQQQHEQQQQQQFQQQDPYGILYSSSSSAQFGLPHISYAATPTQPASSTWAHPVTSQPPPLPRPPLRSRPLSAGAVGGARRNVQTLPPSGAGMAIGPCRSTMVGGWVNPPLTRTSSIPDIQEKDQQLMRLNEEVTRLRSFEFDSLRKDTLIQQLQQQIGDLQGKIRTEPSVIMGNGDMDTSARLLHLETEVTAKKGEIKNLKEQLLKFQQDRSSSPQILRQELGERVKEVTQLRTELDRVRKDKSITAGLVTQMQRDMSQKDSTISRLTREIEVLKKDIRERDVQMSTRKTSPKQAEENSAREKELTTLRQKFKTVEAKQQEHLDTIAALRVELDKVKAELTSETEVSKKQQSELTASRAQVTDVQRSERVVRVDLEQCQNRLERFRSRVIQVAYSTPALKPPEKELSDDDILAALKKLAEDRARLLSNISKLESDVTSAKAGKGDLLGHANTLKDLLQASVDRLKQKGRVAANLKQEVSIVQSALIGDIELTWIKELLGANFQAELDWQLETEAALEKCGVNTKISNDAPSKHIEGLYSRWESSLGEAKDLKAQLEAQAKAHKEELQQRIKAAEEEAQGRIQDAVEKAKLEGEEKLNAAIDEIKAAETEKRESLLEVERRKIEELQTSIEQLRGSLAERSSEDQAQLEEAKLALKEVEALRLLEKDLKERILALEKEIEEQAGKFASEKSSMESQYQGDLNQYKEQVSQHSVTICSMEERLEKLTKKNKDLQEQLSKLRSEKSKPAPPPKPKVIVQRPREELAALEHVVNALRQENTVLKKEIRDSQDVMMGLRRDLAGAQARLSDTAGDVSEAQKQEMERNREILASRAAELTELRQQMAKLTKIIDNQKEEIKVLEGDLSKEKTISAKFQAGLEDRDHKLRMLEDELQREKEEQKKQLDIIDQEGRITSELTSLGAACRGERHGQIIARQREALAELRSKVKALEQSRPPLPTQDQALQQVVQLKKELAEMRVSQAMAEDRVLAEAAGSALDREVGRARGLITPANVEADMERSAHRETMDALECSEASFLTLLRAMAASLDLEEIEGLRPMAHIPKDEREKLVEIRERACQLLANRIQVLKERVARKDELLMGYEQDLAKLRHSQELAQAKSQQVETLANDIRSRSEESEYLRESLNRTRDRLNQEKRLNTAIKTKKTFHLENESNHLSNKNYRGHHCPIEDPKATVRERRQKDLIRRKNYEIRTLKGDLCDTEKELYEREKKLVSLQTSLGLDRPVEVIE